jgi:uncharacterized protein (TIGR03437 family)
VKATLSGSGFLPGTRLVVGAGLTASDTVVSSPLLITATLSATTGAEPGVRTIAVENDAGRSNAVSFTVMAANAPVLYSISPDRAAAGTSVNVLLTGYNFAAGMTVKTDPGVFASNQVFVSTTRLTATLTIPAGTAPGVRNLAVETAGGLSNAIPFTVTSVEIPELTSISPDAGAAGNTIGVTLRGRYFAAGAAIVTGPEIVVSDVRMADSTQLSATFFLAAGAAGGGYPVAVRTAAGTSNSVAFRIDPADAPPALLAVRPNSGTAGQTLNVVLSGTGFSSGAGIQHESGITLRDLRLVSSTGIAATLEIPARALPDSRSLWVLTAAGRSNSLPFTISAAGAPTLVSIDKESGTAGSSVEVVLTGEGFNSGDSVHVSNPGITVASVKATGPARIDAAFRIAATAAGMGNVRVVSAAGLASGAVLFRIRPASGLSISTPSQLPAGVVGQEYVQELAAMGGTAPYGDWRVAAGTLPPGINLALAAGGEAAALQGVPTAAGTYTFTVKVSDRALSEAAKEFTLTVGSGLAAISISAGGIVNGASNEAGPVAPGEVITILGSGLGPATAVYAERGDGGLLPVSLAGTRVLFDGIPAPLIRVHAYQVSAVAPYSLDGKPACQVSLIADGRKSNTVSLAVAATAPGIFTQDYTGKGPGLILNQDGSLNGIENPAPAGSTVRIFATGEGQTDPGGTDGKLADWPAPTPLAKVEVTIGGVEAKVLYAGGSPGLVAGQLHADVEVPPGLTPGAAVPVVMRVGGKNSQSGVVMTVGPAASGTAVAR